MPLRGGDEWALKADLRSSGPTGLVAGGMRALAGRPVLAGLVALLSGGVLVLALPPFSMVAALPVAFGGLLLALTGAGVRQSALRGWLFGLGFFVAGIHWIWESFTVDAERFGALAVPAVLGLSAFLALFVSAAAAAFSAFHARGIAAALLLAACWTAAEWLRGHVLTGFPWNLVGYAWADHDAPRQIAAFVGSYGLGFLTVLASALPAVVIATPDGRHRARAIGLLLILVGVLWGGGALRLAAAPSSPDPGPVLRLVQGNIEQSRKWRPEERAAIVERYLEFSSRAGRYDVLLWPETAFPGFLEEHPAMLARIAEILPSSSVLLTGTPRRTATGDGPAYWNGIVAVNDRGAITAAYDKHHLVPFGEYVPLRGLLPIERMTAGLGDFSAGPGPRTIHLDGIPPVGLSICYEAIFPGDIVDGASRPAWIFNATNDAWFGTSIGPDQHLTAARMRAVEEGLPMVRAANTGISAVIDSHGDIRAHLPLGTAGIIDAPLPPSLPPTVFARYGDLVLIPLLVAAVVAGWRLRRPERMRLRITGPSCGPPHGWRTIIRRPSGASADEPHVAEESGPCQVQRPRAFSGTRRPCCSVLRLAGSPVPRPR